MKNLMIVLALITSFSAFAESLSETALKTLLSSKTIVIGDVHSDESVQSIYKNALSSNAKIENECRIISDKEAKCTLWLTYSPLGETALEYVVLLPGDKLQSPIIAVSRGD